MGSTTTNRDLEQSQVEALQRGPAESKVVLRGVPMRVARAAARTPEELETMFEDALLIGDAELLADLFDDDATLIVGAELPARDGEEIARLALTTWQGSHGYVAGPRYVAQVGDIALILAEEGINIARRSREGAWRYAIVFTSGTADSKGEISDPGTSALLP
jgi:ketosteroid isomerase-like protein